MVVWPKPCKSRSSPGFFILKRRPKRAAFFFAPKAPPQQVIAKSSSQNAASESPRFCLRQGHLGLWCRFGIRLGRCPGSSPRDLCLLGRHWRRRTVLLRTSPGRGRATSREVPKARVSGASPAAWPQSPPGMRRYCSWLHLDDEATPRPRRSPAARTARSPPMFACSSQKNLKSPCCRACTAAIIPPLKGTLLSTK